MKKSIELLGRLSWILAIVVLFSACSSDDDVDDAIDDIVNEGPSLDDGYYIVGGAVSSDTTEANLLVQGTVNAPDFGAQERTGFFEAYVYMGSGSFTFIKVVEGEVTTYTGAYAEETGKGDGDAEQSYYLGAFAEGETAMDAPFEGLVHVSIDETTEQYVIIPINYWEFIGNATESGWSNGQKLEVKSESAAEVVYEAENVILRDGEIKIRANSMWGMNFAEEGCENATTACYHYFTNFGGTFDELVAGIGGGTGNIKFTGDGAYTVTVTYKPAEGISSITAKIKRTGDAPEITFDPSEYKFGVIGNATAGSWDSDQDLFYKKLDDGSHAWFGVVTFGAEGAFKFRTNDAWDFSLGGTLPADGTAGDVSTAGGDIPTPGAGAYYIKLSTADEGTTWSATMINSGWGVIGEGSPQGNWDADIDLTADGYADGVTTYSITGDFTTGEWKFRAGDSWDYNLGGDMAALSADGGNLTVAEAGTYKVVLSFDGSVYSSTATKQ